MKSLYDYGNGNGIILDKKLNIERTLPELHIKYFDPEMPKLEFIQNKSDWIDLRCAETIELKAGESKLIPLGVAMKIMPGYEAHIAPRSSTFKNYGIWQTNSIGVIDNSYSGDNDMWRMPVCATRDVTINKYDRICQFRIVEKQPEFKFVEVEHLDEADRGGFGSTGVN